MNELIYIKNGDMTKTFYLFKLLLCTTTVILEGKIEKCLLVSALLHVLLVSDDEDPDLAVVPAFSPGE